MIYLQHDIVLEQKILIEIDISSYQRDDDEENYLIKF